MNPPLWHRTKGTTGVEHQLLYNVALYSFYLQFLPAESENRIRDRFRTIDVDSIVNKLLAA